MHQFHEGDYTRTTITVPKPLKRRMKMQGSGVNWSNIACSAFRAKLDEMRKERQQVDVKTKEEAIERLRRLKIENTSEPEGAEPGYDCGLTWAKNLAHPDELERLCELGENEDFLRASKRKGPRVMKIVTSTILQIEGKGRMREQVANFWSNQAFAPMPPTSEFVVEFVRGATEFWRDVRDEI